MAPPAFAKVRRCDEAIDGFFDSVRLVGTDERVNVFRRGRQTCQIEVQPPKKCPWLRIRNRLQIGGIEFLHNEAIDRTARPLIAFQLRKTDIANRLKGPRLACVYRRIRGNRRSFLKTWIGSTHFNPRYKIS